MRFFTESSGAMMVSPSASVAPRRAVQLAGGHVVREAGLVLSVPVQAPRGREVALRVDRRVDRRQERDQSSCRSCSCPTAKRAGPARRPSRRSRTGSDPGAWRAAPGCWRRSRPGWCPRCRPPATRSCFASFLSPAFSACAASASEAAALRDLGNREHLAGPSSLTSSWRSRMYSVSPIDGRAAVSRFSRERRANVPARTWISCGRPGFTGPSRGDRWLRLQNDREGERVLERSGGVVAVAVAPARVQDLLRRLRAFPGRYL